MALALRSRVVALPARRSARICTPSTSVALGRPQTRRCEVKRVAASSGDSPDFDAVLASLADKFEKVENKPVVIGYIVAGFSAFFITEWLIHLPALDILLGFPIQLLGVLSLPVLAVRYLVDKKDVSTDVGDAVADITKLLPGLDKK